MKQKLRRLALGVLFGMLALCALSLQAGAAETAFTDQALEGISLPKPISANARAAARSAPQEHSSCFSSYSS